MISIHKILNAKKADPDFLMQERFLSYFREGLKDKMLSWHSYRDTLLGKISFQGLFTAHAFLICTSGFSYIWSLELHLITQTSAKQPNSSPSYLKQNSKSNSFVIFPIPKFISTGLINVIEPSFQTTPHLLPESGKIKMVENIFYRSCTDLLQNHVLIAPFFSQYETISMPLHNY